ncbi:MAG: diguanylate cyclase [Spirochaetia bacterium]
MSNFSERVQTRLRALAETFTKQLPGRMQDVADAAHASLADEPPANSFDDLRMHVHKLAGSAASFGYHHVTVCAKRLEHVIDMVLEDGVKPDGTTRKRIRMLVSELGESTRSHTTEKELEELAEAPGEMQDTGGLGAAGAGVAGQQGVLAKDLTSSELGGLTPVADATAATLSDDQGMPEPRYVSILIGVEELARELSGQLTFYGFTLHRARNVDDLAAAAESDCHLVLILDAGALLTDPVTVDRITALKARCGDELRIMYISDKDDFEIRLLAARTGGEAFFTAPVDMPRLIDKVDSLTTAATEEPYHVLIIDDDMEQVSYHAMILQQAGMITSVVSDPEKMFAILIESKPELILMDMYMPGCTGSELATIVRQQEAFVDIPIIFLSIETDTEKQIKAVSRGGDGFLSKPIKPEHLVSTVRNRVERTRSMRFYMERDSLTGLLNHSHLMHNLSREIQRAERVGRPVCFAMIDLDHFKNVNDTYGHLTGDRVLKSISRHLQDGLRKTDIIGRYGGEEFGVVLFNVDLENAVKVMTKIREDFSRTVHDSGSGQFSVTFSCGIAAYPKYDGPGPIGEAADRALYSAKEAGRNQVVTI